MTTARGEPVGRITSTPEGGLAMVIDGRDYVMASGEVERLMEGEGVGTFLRAPADSRTASGTGPAPPATRRRTGAATCTTNSGHAKQNLFGGNVTFYTGGCICDVPREHLAGVCSGRHLHRPHRQRR